MNVCLMGGLFVVTQRSLRVADHFYSGVLWASLLCECFVLSVRVLYEGMIPCTE